MQITYQNKKIQKVCTIAAVAKKEYNADMAERIMLRIAQIKAAETVEELISVGVGRCHCLIGNRKNQYAIDLIRQYRLIFTITKNGVQIANIIEIVDYH